MFWLPISNHTRQACVFCCTCQVIQKRHVFLLQISNHTRPACVLATRVTYKKGRCFCYKYQVIQDRQVFLLYKYQSYKTGTCFCYKCQIITCINCRTFVLLAKTLALFLFVWPHFCEVILISNCEVFI